MRRLPSLLLYLLLPAILFVIHWTWGTVDGELDFSSQQLWEFEFLESPYAYFYILLITIAFPFLLSFDKKVHYYKKWKYLWAPYLFIGAPFIIWDIYFTKWSVWGFNQEYLSGWEVYNLPLEEVLFFVVVPYACIFIYECVKAYRIAQYVHRLASGFVWLIGLSAVFFVSINSAAYYTFSAGVGALFVIAYLELFVRRGKRREIYVTLFLSFLPFLLINGLLTGLVTRSPVVVYNMSENLGIRLLSIPVDDFYYQAAMLGSMLLVYERVKK